MSSQRSAGTKRSLVFINALLLSSAIALPAMAQIEEVVVTAQKKSEDIQTVPIAVTAFSAQDLAAHQILMAKDLQFATPNVTYTKTNFTGTDFSIRGVGNDVISGGGESGVAVHVNDIYESGAALDNNTFFDLDQVAVLRGPQSTLFGRGATGGTINIVTAKPDLDQAFVTVDASYGNFGSNEDRGVVNIPLVDGKLGMRLAADYVRDDGLVTNDFNHDHIDSNNTWAFRGSFRWEPTEATTIDLIVSSGGENDTKMRSQRQRCLYDPSGILGCLPGGLANDSINEHAFFAADIISQQSVALAAPALAGLAPLIGLDDLTTTSPVVHNPSAAWHVSTDFTPTKRDHGDEVQLHVKQNLASWLDFNLDADMNHGDVISQESYNNSAAQPLPFLGHYNPLQFGVTKLGTIAGLFYGGLPFASPAYYANYLPFFSTHDPLHPADTLLPVSGLSGWGVSTGNVAYYTNSFSTFDQSNGKDKQYSIDFRFASKFDGPINFLLGGFYLRSEASGDYFVSSGAQTYAALFLGGLTCASVVNVPSGCIIGTPYYDNHSPAGSITLKSKAIYGEVYYDIVPSLLKLTLGARFTEDSKSQLDRITLLTDLQPLGFGNSDAGHVPYGANAGQWDKFTGRVVLNYTPELSFTDRTLIYGSLSRGYKAGGFNPGVQPGLGVPINYAPEGVDAIEIGTKNTMLNGTLQGNLTGWYYNYENLQVSQIINNTSVNANINERLYGVEGEFQYAPDSHWAFNLNLGYTHSAVGNTSLVDPRDPTNGNANAVLIKDYSPTGTAAQNCALYLGPAAVLGGANQTVSPGANAAFTLALGGHNPYFTPPGGQAALAPYGIPLANYGLCGAVPPALLGALNAFGYYFVDPTNPNNTRGGVPISLHGNQGQNTPDVTLSFGAQYTFDLAGDYTLVPRVDVYWQDSMWGRVFEKGADRIASFESTNLEVTLTAPDNLWYAQAFVKNAFNSTYVTGQYLTSSSSGLYTNEFLGDPRLYGVRLGVHF